jgi:hypothetical protein
MRESIPFYAMCLDSGKISCETKSGLYTLSGFGLSDSET